MARLPGPCHLHGVKERADIRLQALVVGVGVVLIAHPGAVADALETIRTGFCQMQTAERPGAVVPEVACRADAHKAVCWPGSEAADAVGVILVGDQAHLVVRSQRHFNSVCCADEMCTERCAAVTGYMPVHHLRKGAEMGQHSKDYDRRSHDVRLSPNTYFIFIHFATARWVPLAASMTYDP